jgi:hypothetical protein
MWVEEGMVYTRISDAYYFRIEPKMTDQVPFRRFRNGNYSLTAPEIAKIESPSPLCQERLLGHRFREEKRNEIIRQRHLSHA